MSILIRITLSIGLIFTTLFAAAQPDWLDCECDLELDPVCVVLDDGEVYPFPNACIAECLGLTLSDEPCFDDDFPCDCAWELDPVCVEGEDGELYPFPNGCFAECLGLTVIADANCDWPDEDDDGDDDEDDDNGDDDDGDNDGDDDDEEDGDGDDDDQDDDEDDCDKGKGYWKTHSEYGPAAYDEAWGELDSGADTPLMETGSTYLAVLDMSSGGNIYIKLAQEYIVAELNSLAGYELTDEEIQAWDEAGALLADYEEEMAIGVDSEDHETAVELRDVLKDFNDCEDDEDDEEDDDEDEGDDEDGEDGGDDDGDSDEEDCVKGKGYWKTHSEYGPASFDEAWGELDSGADTQLMETGSTYLEVLDMSSGGNMYVKLAQEYIIAHLNALAGFELTDEQADSWDEAGALLANYEEEMEIASDSEDHELASDLRNNLKEFNECEDDEDGGGFAPEFVSSLVVFPNPASSAIGLKMETNEVSNIKMQITNHVGAEFYTNKFEVEDGTNEFSIPTENLPIGIYFVRIWVDGKQEVIQRFVKQQASVQ